MSNHKLADQTQNQAVRVDALTLPLDRLDGTLLPLVGGKAAQLGELIRAGFAVPAGFCVTTMAYARVSESAAPRRLSTRFPPHQPPRRYGERRPRPGE